MQHRCVHHTLGDLFERSVEAVKLRYPGGKKCKIDIETFDPPLLVRKLYVEVVRVAKPKLL